MEKPKILVIVGPTASGKSALAVRLAKKFKGEIISADSRQVYKGLDVGTGKITKREMGGIPHYLLDVADPRKQFSAAKYKKLALNSLQYIVTKTKLPIIVGGTGFYIDTLTGVTNFPDIAPNKLLRNKLSKLNAKKLFLILKKKDQRRAQEIDPNNKVRLIRALEIVETLGKVPLLHPNSTEQAANKFIFIGLRPDNLDQRIRERLLQRLELMIKEAKKLVKLKAINYRRMHELGLEYRYIGMYLQNKISKSDLTEKLYTEIRRYAKRQITWFKRNKKIRWFKPEEEAKIEKEIRKVLL